MAKSQEIHVEVNLRIPAVKQPRMDASGYPINSANVRFTRDVELPSVPKPGEVLQLETTDGTFLACEVLRADWSDAKDRFIVYCTYANRSIPPQAYNALLDAPDWKMRPLL